MLQSELPYPRSWALINPRIGVLVLASALHVGTGGVQTESYYRQRGPMGYPFVPYAPAAPAMSPLSGAGGESTCPPDQSFADACQSGIRTPSEDLSHIRNTLKPSVTDLAKAIGVSRQAIYDWQYGKPIAAENAIRLAQLARVADIFANAGISASAQLLRRPIEAGKTLFDIARDGGFLEQPAGKLVDIIRREIEQRKELDARRGHRPGPAISPREIGVPSMTEVG